MKKTIFILVMTAFMIGSLTTGCKRKSEKEEEKVPVTHEERQDAKIKMVEQKVEIDETEWNNFMKEIDAEMKADEMMINDLKTEMKKPGKKHDVAYSQKVDSLEKKHAELQNEIKTYDKNQKEWDKFKSRFKKDMDTLGKDLKDLKTGKKK